MATTRDIDVKGRVRSEPESDLKPIDTDKLINFDTPPTMMIQGEIVLPRLVIVERATGQRHSVLLYETPDELRNPIVKILI